MTQITPTLIDIWLPRSFINLGRCFSTWLLLICFRPREISAFGQNKKKGKKWVGFASPSSLSLLAAGDSKVIGSRGPPSTFTAARRAKNIYFLHATEY